MNKRPVHQFNEKGEYLATFETARHAEEDLNLVRTSATRGAYRGDIIAQKWYFSYNEDWKITDPKPDRKDRIKIHTTKTETQKIYRPVETRPSDVFILGCF